MESYAYVCKDNKEMGMVFDKNVSRNEIEKYEKDCLEKVSNLSLMSVLKEELDKRGWHFRMKFSILNRI